MTPSSFHDLSALQQGRSMQRTSCAHTRYNAESGSSDIVDLSLGSVAAISALSARDQDSIIVCERSRSMTFPCQQHRTRRDEHVGRGIENFRRIEQK